MDAYTDNKIKNTEAPLLNRTCAPLLLFFTSHLFVNCSTQKTYTSANCLYRILETGSKPRQYGLSGTVSSIDVVANFYFRTAICKSRPLNASSQSRDWNQAIANKQKRTYVFLMVLCSWICHRGRGATVCRSLGNHCYRSVSRTLNVLDILMYLKGNMSVFQKLYALVISTYIRNCSVWTHQEKADSYLVSKLCGELRETFGRPLPAVCERIRTSVYGHVKWCKKINKKNTWVNVNSNDCVGLF